MTTCSRGRRAAVALFPKAPHDIGTGSILSRIIIVSSFIVNFVDLKRISFYRVHADFRQHLQIEFSRYAEIGIRRHFFSSKQVDEREDSSKA